MGLATSSSVILRHLVESSTAAGRLRSADLAVAQPMPLVAYDTRLRSLEVSQVLSSSGGEVGGWGNGEKEGQKKLGKRRLVQIRGVEG